MKRIVLYLVVLGVLLYVIKATAPLLMVGAIGLVLLAWKRPEMVGRLADRPQVAGMPAAMRATPMRFAATIGFAAFLLTLPLGAAADSPDPSSTPRPTVAVATEKPTAEPTPTETPVPTTEPTRRPTPEPTRRPTPEPTPHLGAEPTGPAEGGTVTNVVDGDTIDVLVDGIEMRVRYIGMDTPEVHSGVEWLGPEAAQANAELVLGKEVVLEHDVSESDRFGRALRYVWLEDSDGWLLVNLEMIRLGLASITTFPPDVKYVEELYVPAQDEAQQDGVGMWGPTPTPRPTPVPTPRPTAVPTAKPAPVVTPSPVAPPPPVPPAPGPTCHASYIGFCLTVGVGDWDCAGGSGNGPNYVPVMVEVVGFDEYGLNNDPEQDPYGCDSLG